MPKAAERGDRLEQAVERRLLKALKEKEVDANTLKVLELGIKLVAVRRRHIEDGEWGAELNGPQEGTA